MKRSSQIFAFSLTGLLLTGTGTASRAADDLVVAPAVRQSTLEAGKKLVSAKELPATFADPFSPPAFAEALAVASGKGGDAAANAGTDTGGKANAGPRGGRDLLQAIAASLKTSGYFVIGGEPTLVFGQKRVKAGGTLTITFEGTEYTLEIVSIARPNFTLRLNREEFTRPIK